jgi:hypothetical protein
MGRLACKPVGPVLVGLAFLLPGPLESAESDARLGDTISAPQSTISISGSGAWTAAHVFGGVRDPGRGTAILEMSLSRSLQAKESICIDYVAGVVPLELAVGTVVSRPDAARGLSLAQGTVYGAGLDLLGVRIRARKGTWRPFAAASGGFRVFTEPMPTPRGTRFNFAADLGIGILRRVAPSRFLSFGVDLHHVSNGGLGEANPSVNLFALSVGFLSAR